MGEEERLKKYWDWVAKQTNCIRCGKEFEEGEQRWEWVKGLLCTKCFNEHLPMALNRLNRVLGGESVQSVLESKKEAEG